MGRTLGVSELASIHFEIAWSLHRYFEYESEDFPEYMPVLIKRSIKDDGYVEVGLILKEDFETIKKENSDRLSMGTWGQEGPQPKQWHPKILYRSDVFEENKDDVLKYGREVNAFFDRVPYGPFDNWYAWTDEYQVKTVDSSNFSDAMEMLALALTSSRPRSITVEDELDGIRTYTTYVEITRSSDDC